jgi:hypothetical protein
VSGERINLARLKTPPAFPVATSGALTVPVYWTTLAALVEAVEAAHQAIVLEYDPARTDEQNRLIYERAQSLHEALARFDFGERA